MATVGEPPAKIPEPPRLDRQDAALCLCEGIYRMLPRPGAKLSVRLQALQANRDAVVDSTVPFLNPVALSAAIHVFYKTTKERRSPHPLDIKNTSPGSRIPDSFIEHAYDRAGSIRGNVKVELMRLLLREIGEYLYFIPEIEMEDSPISPAQCKQWYDALSRCVSRAANASLPKPATLNQPSRARSSSVSSTSSTSSTSSSSTLKEEETGQFWWAMRWIWPCLGRSRKGNTEEHTPLLAEKEVGTYSAV